MMKMIIDNDNGNDNGKDLAKQQSFIPDSLSCWRSLKASYYYSEAYS